jgi:hypothetical protein
MTRGRKPLTDAPERLDDLARKRILKWAEAKWPKIKPKLGRYWADCRDWHLANGVQRASWEATFRRWLRKQEEISAQSQGRDMRPQPGSRELPQQPRSGRKSTLTPLLDIVRGQEEESGKGKANDNKAQG